MKSKTQDQAIKMIAKKPEIKQTEKSQAKKPITFLERIKELSKAFFILFSDSKKEIAIIKEKTLDVSSPINVLHCVESNSIHADYDTMIKENIGQEILYKTVRIGKGKYKINPVLCGFFHHYCERMQSKRDMIFKANKDKTKASKIYLKEISCDLKNFNRICISFYLDDMIKKDFPAIKGTLKNTIDNYFIVNDCEKGIIEYVTK